MLRLLVTGRAVPLGAAGGRGDSRTRRPGCLPVVTPGPAWTGRRGAGGGEGAAGEGGVGGAEGLRGQPSDGGRGGVSVTGAQREPGFRDREGGVPGGEGDRGGATGAAVHGAATNRGGRETGGGGTSRPRSWTGCRCRCNQASPAALPGGHLPPRGPGAGLGSLLSSRSRRQRGRRRVASAEAHARTRVGTIVDTTLPCGAKPHAH